MHQPALDQASQNPTWIGEGTHEASSLPEELLAADGAGQGKVSLPQLHVTVDGLTDMHRQTTLGGLHIYLEGNKTYDNWREKWERMGQNCKGGWI